MQAFFFSAHAFFSSAEQDFLAAADGVAPSALTAFSPEHAFLEAALGLAFSAEAFPVQAFLLALLSAQHAFFAEALAVAFSAVTFFLSQQAFFFEASHAGFLASTSKAGALVAGNFSGVLCANAKLHTNTKVIMDIKDFIYLFF